MSIMRWHYKKKLSKSKKIKCSIIRARNISKEEETYLTRKLCKSEKLEKVKTRKIIKDISGSF